MSAPVDAKTGETSMEFYFDFENPKKQYLPLSLWSSSVSKIKIRSIQQGLLTVLLLTVSPSPPPDGVWPPGGLPYI